MIQRYFIFNIDHTVEKLLLSNFLWSHTPLFGHILLHIHYKMWPKSGVWDAIRSSIVRISPQYWLFHSQFFVHFHGVREIRIVYVFDWNFYDVWLKFLKKVWFYANCVLVPIMSTLRDLLHEDSKRLVKLVLEETLGTA